MRVRRSGVYFKERVEVERSGNEWKGVRNSVKEKEGLGWVNLPTKRTR